MTVKELRSDIDKKLKESNTYVHKFNLSNAECLSNDGWLLYQKAVVTRDMLSYFKTKLMEIDHKSNKVGHNRRIEDVPKQEHVKDVPKQEHVKDVPKQEHAKGGGG